MKTEQDYIQKAVELAPNEFCTWDEKDKLVWFTPLGRIMGKDDQWFLDALAAQLVRQTDTENWEFECYSDCALMPMYGHPYESVLIRGPDRTMNTIRAIVDSGVLDDS